MKKGDYAKTLSVAAPAKRLFECIATADGVRGWWTPLVRGSHEAGKTFRLSFEGMDEHIDIRTEVVRRPSQVVWTIAEHTSLEEWDGTKVHFTITPEGESACVLAFEHEGLTPKLVCYEDCEAGWDHFLGSLVAFAERGVGSPFGTPRERR